MTNYIWDVTSGNFGAASSWSPRGTPTSSDTTNIDESTSLFGSGSAQSLTIYNAITVTISALLTTSIASYTYVGGGNGAPTVDVDATWSNTGYIVIGGNGSGSGDLYVNAGGSITASQLYVGPDNTGSSPAGTGTATVQGGGKVTTNGPYYDEIGGGSGGNGSLTVTGTGSSWISGQGLSVGDNGTGVLTVENDATLNTPVLDVGVSYDQPTVASGSGTAYIESGGVVTTTGQYQEIGDGSTGASDDAIEGATGAVTVTGAGSEWNAENGEIFIGDAGSKTGSLTISNGGNVTAANGFGIGQQYLGADGSYGALLIDSGGTAVTGGGYSNVGGNNSGQPTSTVTVTGAGSSWNTDDIIINATGKVAVTSGGTIRITGPWLGLQGGALQVDSDSTFEVGDVGGAALGFLTVDPDPNYNSNLFAEGTIEADVIDNGKIYSNEFDGQGTFVIEGPTGVADTGTVTGDGYLFVGTQSPLDLAVASVASTLHVEFVGWDTALEIEATGFSAPIQNFNDGDAIDIQGLAYDSGASSYTFTPSGADGAGTLVIKEGASSVTLDIATSPQTISGNLTLSSYAGGAGTVISFTNGAAQSPFQIWSTEGSFFNTSNGTVDGEDYGLSNSTDGGTPIWVETETPASSYVSAAPDNYTLVLATQDWLGDIQPEITIATDNDFVNPFGSNNLGAGNLAAATILSNNATTGTGGVVYWSASSTVGDYAVDFEPFTVSYPSSPPSSNLVTITGSPVTMISAIANPLSWTFSVDTPTSLVFAYMTQDTGTTENLYMEGFNASGAATNSAPVLIASGLPDGTPYYVGDYTEDDQFSGYGYRYLEIGGSLGTGLVAGTFNTTTGALGAPTLFLSLPDYTSFDGVYSHLLSNSSNTIRLVEGVEDGQAVIQSFINGSTADATFDLSSASDHFAAASVYDPNTGAVDYTVLAYTDAGEVHLELLNETGGQIGADYVVPGISSFLRLNTMQGNTSQSSTRVELDYEVADPNGGQEIKGFIFDTDSFPYDVTLSDGGLYNGSPFDDAFTWAAGNYTIGGGGGVDTFVVPLNANRVAFSIDSSGDVVVQTYTDSTLTTSTGSTTLVDFADVQMNGSTIAISQTANGEDLAISAGGLLQLAGATPSHDAISFSPGGGELAIEGGASLGGTIDGFAALDKIDLAGLRYGGSASSYSVAEVGTTDVYDVTVNEGSSSFVLPFEQATPVTNTEFKLRPDSGTGTQLVLSVVTWAGAVSNDWNNGANWSTGVVPGAGDTILVPATPSGGRAPEILDNETVSVYGNIVNDDVITVASTGDQTNFVINGSVTLSGTGTLTLTDSATNRVFSNTGGSTLDNQETINGAGQIFNNDGLTFKNDATGVVDATGSNALSISGVTVENLGLLESTVGTGGLELASATVDNTDGGTADSGQIEAAGGNVLIENSVDIIGGTLSSTTGSQIEVASTGSTLDGSHSAAVDIAKGGVVAVENSENLTLEGVIENNGQLQLNATGGNNTDLIVNGAVTLKGTGDVILSDAGTIHYNRIYSNQGNSTLDNQQTIEGAGEIFTNDGLTLDNDTMGVVDATGNNALDIHNIAVENQGVLESTAGIGGLELAEETIDNTDGGTTDSGRIEAEGGNVLIEDSVHIIGGTLSSASGDQIEVLSTSSTLDGSQSADVDITKGSVVAIENGENLVLNGAIENDGQLQLNATGADNTDLIINGAVTLKGAGAVVLSGVGTIHFDRIYSNQGGSTLDNQETIEGVGEIFTNDGLTLNNDDVIDANGAFALAVHDFAVNNADLLESTSGAGGLLIYNATVSNLANNDSGQIVANGAGTHVDIYNSTIVGGKLVSENGGVINVTTGGAVTFNGTNSSAPVDITGGSVVALANGATLDVTGTIQNDGQLQLNATSADNTDLIINGAVTLKGAGDVVLSDAGTIHFDRIYSNQGGSTLDNQETIEGAGEIFTNDGLTLNNDDVIDATGANALAVHNITVNNADLLESTTGAGGLSIYTATISNLAKNDSGQIVANGAGTHVGIYNSTIVGGKLVSENGGVINVTTGGADIFDGTNTGAPVDITSGSVVAVADSATLDITGTIQNDGQLQLNATRADNTDLIVNGAVTLKGAGDVILSDAGSIHFNRIYSNQSGSTLDNQETIEGAGEIFTNDGLILDNDATGIVDATGNNALAVHDITVNNAGLLESTSGNGGLLIENATINNLVGDNTGQIVANGDITHVDIDNSSIIGGDLVSEDGGIINVTAGGADTFNGTNSGGPVDITSGSVVSVANSAALNIEGTIQNDGELQLNATGPNNTDLIVSGDTTLSGDGAIILSDEGTTHYNRIYTNTPGSTLDNQETIEGAGEIFSNDGLTLVNDTAGVINANGANALDIHNIVFTNDGAVSAGNGGTLEIDDALTNISADPNHTGGSVLTGGAYNLVDQETAGDGPGAASTIAISGNGANKITTLAATVDLAGQPSQLTSNGISLANSLLEVADDGDLNLYYGYNSGYSQNFADPNALTIDEGGQVSVNGADFSTAGLTIANGGYLLTDGEFDDTTPIYASVEGPIVNNGLIVADGVEEVATQPTSYFGGPISGTGAITLDQDALAEFGGGGVGDDQTVYFGNDQVLSGAQIAGEQTIKIDSSTIDPDATAPGAFSATIANFTLGDAIDLTNFDDFSDYTYNNGLLTVFFDTDQVAKLNLSGLGANANFRFSSDGDGGTLITAGTGAELANDTGVSATDGVTDDAALTGTGDPGATLIFVENGVQIGTTVVADNGLWGFKPSGLEDGAQTIVVSELSGNFTTEVASVAFALATQAPVATVSQTLSGLTNKTTDVISGVATAEEVPGNGIDAVEIINLDDDIVRFATLGADDAYSANLTGLSDGGHVFEVVTIDIAGNATSAQLANVIIATQAPTVTASESVSGTTTETDDLISATAVAENSAYNAIASVIVYDGQTELGAASNSGATWVFDAEDLAPGAHDFSLVTTDEAGNSTTTRLAPVDVASGSDPTVTASISNPGLTKQTSETIIETATAVAGNTIVGVEVYDGGKDLGAASFNSQTQSWSFSATGLADGENQFSTVTIDSGDNQTTTTLPVVDIATEAPVNGSPGESVSGVTNKTSDTISVTPSVENVPGNGVASVEIVDSSTNKTIAATPGAGGVYSATLTGLSDGAHVFDIVTTDNASNSTMTALTTVDVATRAPVNGSSTESVSGLTKKTSDTISVTPTVENVPGNGVASVEIVDTSTNGMTAATLGAGGVYSATLTGLGDGAHVFNIVTTDAAGNQTTTTLASVDIATQAPTISASESVSGTTNQTSDILSATVTPENIPGNSIVSVVAFDGEAELGAATLLNGVWSYTANDLAPGDHTFSLEATDAAGNAQSSTLTPVNVVSRSGPTVNANISTPGLTRQTSETISETATASAGNTIAGVEVYDNNVDLGAASFNSDSRAWSFTATGLADGANEFSTVTTDSDDNQTTVTLPFVDIATEAPVNGSSSESVSGITKQTSETISVTPTAEKVPGNGVASVEILDTSTDAETAAELGAGGVYSATLTGLKDGAHLFEIITTDNAGNSTTTTLSAVDIATQDPTLYASESVSGSTTQTSDILTATATAEQAPGNSIVSVLAYDGETEIGAATLLDGVWSYTASDLAPGDHSFALVANDAAGNSTKSTLAPVDVVSGAGPTVSASTSTPGLTNQTSETISETATAAQGSTVIRVEVFDNDLDLGAASFNSDTQTWSFTASDLADGANDFSTLTTDSADRTTTTTLPVVDIATQAPVNGSASESVSGITNKTSERISVTPTVENVAGNGVASVDVIDTLTHTTTAATLGAGGIYSATLAGLGDGAHIFDIVTTDKAGNSATTALAALDIATQGPTVKASESISGASGLTTEVITATAAAEQVSNNSIASVFVYSGQTDLGKATFSNGAWSYTVSGLALGAHDFSLVTTDAAGNSTTTTLAPVDVIQPLSVWANESVSGLTDVASDTISAAAGAAPGLAVTGVEAFDGNTDLGAATFHAATDLWSFSAKSLSDGVHDFSTLATDSAGDTLRATLAAVEVATAAPSVAASQTLGRLNKITQDTITETATAEAVGANAIKSVVVYDGATYLGAAHLSGGIWSFTTATLVDGAHYLQTVTSDVAGNTITKALAAVYVATAAPTVSVSQSLSGLTTQTQDLITETATAEPVGANAIISVEVFDGSTDLGAATLSGGSWRFTTQPLALGKHDLSTVTTDSAGDATTFSLAPINVEPPAPNVTVVLIDDTSDGFDITSNDALSGRGDPNAVVRFTIDGSLIAQTATANSNGAWTFTPTGLSQGRHTIVASETNGGGTGSATLSFSYLTTPPSVSIATPSGAVAFPSETIDGKGETGTTVQLFDGSKALGAAVKVAANGLWSDTVTLPGAGANTITAEDTDAANNVDISSAITLFLDTQTVAQSAQTQVSSSTGNNHIILSATNTNITAVGGDDTVSLASVGGATQLHIITGGGVANTLDLSGTSGGAVVNLGLQLATGSEIGKNEVFNFQNIIGGAGPETLTLNSAPGGGTGPAGGGAGPPTQVATTGESFIEAGSGDDIMTGSPNGSTFAILSAFGNDTITNFNVSGSSHDVFEVSQSLFANWSAIDAALSDTAAGAELVLHTAETVTFTGVTKAALEANSSTDFRFV